MSKVKTDKFVMQLPFDGFYESIYSHELDREAEQYAEYSEEREPEEEPNPELRLVRDEFQEILFDVTDHRKSERAVCVSYVSAVEYELGSEFDLNVKLNFESMSSPREYNFETDRIFVEIDRKSLATLIRAVRSDRYESLRQVIEDRHTSRSGFCSFYDNTLEKWLKKPVSTWDHNELNTLIQAAVLSQSRGAENASDFWRWTVYYRVVDCDSCYNEFCEGVDWKAFDEKVTALRNEKAEAIRENNEGWTPIERCPNTPDMLTTVRDSV